MSSCKFGGWLKKICPSVHLVRCVAKRSFCSRFFRVMAGDQNREGVYGGDLNVVLAFPPIARIYKTCYCIFSCVIGLLPKGSFWFHLYVGLHLFIPIPQAYSLRWKATHMKAWQTLWGGRRRRRRRRRRRPGRHKEREGGGGAQDVLRPGFTQQQEQEEDTREDFVCNYVHEALLWFSTEPYAHSDTVSKFTIPWRGNSISVFLFSSP